MGLSMHSIISYFKDESGASAAEYALILAVIAGGLVAAIATLGGNISAAINGYAADINP